MLSFYNVALELFIKMLIFVFEKTPNRNHAIYYCTLKHLVTL